MHTLTARTYHDHSHTTPFAQITLDYDTRFLRRKMLETDDGQPILIDLPQTTSLDHGGVLVLADGREVLVQAAAQDLLEITGPDMPRIAWHIGNRHTPCQIEDRRLLIQPDHVIRDMLAKIGATVREVNEPFIPEGGAYGHGRTHSHAH